MLNIERVTSYPMTNGYYLIPKSEQIDLNKDIDYINQVLNDNAICIRDRYIPALNYDEDPDFRGPCNHTKLEIIPLTPTGKKPKYKAFVRFATFKGDYHKDWGNDTFGDIYYLQDGTIGKAKIIMWRDKVLTVVHLKIIDNELKIYKIDRK